MDTLAIIKRIELRLAELGMSKAEFYERSGISSASYSQWNTGKYNPSMLKLHQAADVLGLDFDYLCYGLAQTENAPTLTEKGERSGVVSNMNILRIAGRDGSFEERVLTDDQLATVRAFLNLLPDASDDL